MKNDPPFLQEDERRWYCGNPDHTNHPSHAKVDEFLERLSECRGANEALTERSRQIAREERERCARIADEYDHYEDAASRIAAAIRSLGDVP